MEDAVDITPADICTEPLVLLAPDPDAIAISLGVFALLPSPPDTRDMLLPDETDISAPDDNSDLTAELNSSTRSDVSDAAPTELKVMLPSDSESSVFIWCDSNVDTSMDPIFAAVVISSLLPMLPPDRSDRGPCDDVSDDDESDDTDKAPLLLNVASDDDCTRS